MKVNGKLFHVRYFKNGTNALDTTTWANYNSTSFFYRSDWRKWQKCTFDIMDYKEILQEIDQNEVMKRCENLL